jgi:radical SAM superfamily enzyme YgiQ (UPF0313 family)
VSNILLIHPSKKITGKKDSFYTKEYLTPSLGLGMVAASVVQSGRKVSIIDMRLPHRGISDVFAEIKSRKPVIIGITSFTNEVIAAGKMAEIIKNEIQSSFIVLGGPHSTVYPEGTLKEFPSIDAVVMGEGEETIVELLDAIENNKSFEDIKGIAFRKNGKTTVNEERKRAVDINNLPPPAWELFEINYYTGPFMISASRGCPYPCYFCTPNYLGRVRVRDPLKVVDEIQRNVEQFGASRFQFADATLSLLEEKTSIMCDEIIKRGLNSRITWECETRADKIDEKLLRKMKEAGCRCIALGVETGSERILKEVIKKGETKEDIRRAVSLIKDSGIRVRCFFLLGHCSETIETIKETIDFALELKPDGISFGLLVPNPGTMLRKIAEEGKSGLRILHNRWDEYSQLNFSCMELSNIPIRELKHWQSKAYFIFYMRHPFKAFNLIFSESGYNYSLKGLIVAPFKLFLNFMRRR